MAIIGNYQENFRLGRTLDGTSDADTIYGHGGNDYLLGGAGTDVLYGGAGNDFIYASSYALWNHNADWGGSGVEYAVGGAGNDIINFSMTTHDYNVLYGDDFSAGVGEGIDNVYGGSGIDYIYGGGASDVLDGGDGNDIIYGDFTTDSGNDGGDVLRGGGGSDYLYGGGGDDQLDGGSGGDWLTGGMGHNTFAWSQDSSGTVWATADTITDFYAPWDSISVIGSANANNYAEVSTRFSGFDNARTVASYLFNDDDITYAFVTDGTNGYIFADFDNNGGIDSGVELQGLSSLSEFSYADII